MTTSLKKKKKTCSPYVYTTGNISHSLSSSFSTSLSWNWLRTTDELSCRANIHLSPLSTARFSSRCSSRKWAQISVWWAIHVIWPVTYFRDERNCVFELKTRYEKKANKKEIYSKWLFFFSKRKKENSIFFLLTWPICNVLYYIYEFFVGENAQSRQNIPLNSPPLKWKPKEKRGKKKKCLIPPDFWCCYWGSKQQAAHSNLRERENVRECLLISPPLLATFVVVYIFDLETVDKTSRIFPYVNVLALLWKNWANKQTKNKNKKITKKSCVCVCVYRRWSTVGQNLLLPSSKFPTFFFVYFKLHFVFLFGIILDLSFEKRTRPSSTNDRILNSPLIIQLLLRSQHANDERHERGGLCKLPGKLPDISQRRLNFIFFFF